MENYNDYEDTYYNQMVDAFDDENKYIFENSTDINELESLLIKEKENANYYKLKEWQQSVLNKTTTQQSFCRFNDRKKITMGLAKRFLRKNGRPLDVIALEDFGEAISPEDIADFMVEVSNYSEFTRKTTDLYNEIKKKITRLKNESKQVNKKVAVIRGTLEIPENINIVYYSEKSVAVIGETFVIKDMLKKIGGRFNKFLSCGAGWIFPKTKQTELEKVLFNKNIGELKQ